MCCVFVIQPVFADDGQRTHYYTSYNEQMHHNSICSGSTVHFKTARRAIQRLSDGKYLNINDPQGAAVITTRLCERETRVLLSNLTWHRHEFRSFESRVSERVFVEDVRDLRVLGRRGGGVRLKRREAEVQFW